MSSMSSQACRSGVPDISALIARARGRLSAQRTVPLSPGTVDGDGVRLCAAAALVAAAIAEKEDDGAAEQFARQAVVEGSDYVVESARRAGLDQTMVAGVLVSNDRFSDARRRDGMLEFLDGLARQLATR